ncbi:SDR family oxidoreductase [Paenibacillus filicis]|uniref:SDR family oxidoreductase n=1 Tax=Paenibacillus filicis TaxID=669464 RepID=A0ABU9DLT6_9BACL
MRLRDKVIVVTGGTRGIGRGIAFNAASEGATTVISGIDPVEGRQTAEDIAKATGATVYFLHGDLRSEEACERLIEVTAARFGRIDGLVNNAGIFPRGTLLETTEELYETIFAVNMKAPFFCSKYAIESMMRTGGGSIVHIGSIHGHKGSEDLAAYACSKGALLTLNRHIAGNYGKYGIRSNWITVGWVATEGELELHQSRGADLHELQEFARTHIPSGSMQTAEDIAHGVIYLLSDQAAQVTGSELKISGGLGV